MWSTELAVGSKTRSRSRSFRGRENRSPSSSPDSALPPRRNGWCARGACGLTFFRKVRHLVARQRSQHGNLPEL